MVLWKYNTENKMNGRVAIAGEKIRCRLLVFNCSPDMEHVLCFMRHNLHILSADDLDIV